MQPTQITVTSIFFRRMLLNDDTGSPRSVRSICLTSGNQKAKPPRLATTGTSYVPRTCNGEHGAVLMTGKGHNIGNHLSTRTGALINPGAGRTAAKNRPDERRKSHTKLAMTETYNMKPGDLTPPSAGHELIRGTLPRGKFLPLETQVPCPTPV